MQWLIEMDALVRPYINEIAMAIIATLLVLFGNDINSAIRALVKRYHFVIRTLAFVLICAFGYGLLTVWITPLFAGVLLKLSFKWLLPTIVLVFIGLGMFAQKQRHI